MGDVASVGKSSETKLFDTRGPIKEIVCNGNYSKAVRKIIQYVHSAPDTADYFRVKLFEEVAAYICIWSLYLRGLQIVEQINEIENNMEGDDDGKVKGTEKGKWINRRDKEKSRYKEKRVKEHRKVVSKEKEGLGEKVFVFGTVKENPPRYFMNAELLGFEEGYPGIMSPIGKMAFRRAVGHVFNTVKTDKLGCLLQCFTIVQMLCEGPRFKPLSKYFNLAEDVNPEPFVSWLIHDWECMTNVARRRTQDDTYVKPRRLTLEVFNDLKGNPAWADDQLAIRHDHKLDRSGDVDEQLFNKILRRLNSKKESTKREALDSVSEIIKAHTIPHSNRLDLARSLFDCAEDEELRDKAMKLLTAIDRELALVLPVLVSKVCSTSDSYATRTLVEVLKHNTKNPRIISKMLECLSDVSLNNLDVADRVLNLIPIWSISVTNWNLLIFPIVEEMLAKPNCVSLKFLDCIRDQLSGAASYVLQVILHHTESQTVIDTSSSNENDRLCPLSILRLLPTEVFKDIRSSVVYDGFFSKNIASSGKTDRISSETWCIATLLRKRAFNELEYEAVRKIAAELCGRLHPDFLFQDVSSKLKCATENQDLLTIKACLSIVHTSLEVGGREYVHHDHIHKLIAEIIGSIIMLSKLPPGDNISETRNGCIDCVAAMVCTELQGNPLGNCNPLHAHIVDNLIHHEKLGMKNLEIFHGECMARILMSACDQISDSCKTTLGLTTLEKITSSIRNLKEPKIIAACIKVLCTIVYGLKSDILPHSSDLLNVSLDFLVRESKKEWTGGAELLSSLLKIDTGVVRSISDEARTRLSSLSQTDSSPTVRGLVRILDFPID